MGRGDGGGGKDHRVLLRFRRKEGMQNHRGSFSRSRLGIACIPLARTHACDPIWLQGVWQVWPGCVLVKKGSGSLEL